MRILSIETSCDETAIALVEASGGLSHPKFNILKNLVASQIKIHQPFGGVVPNLAKREHLKNLPLLMGKILGISNFQFPISKQILNSKFKILNSIDLVAVTVGPGLEPALWTGINFSQELYKNLKPKTSNLKPVLGVSHLDGHLYSFLLQQKTISQKSKVKSKKFLFPAIALIVSGGHTILIKMDSLIKYKILGETVDDAVGEAFDKVARLLNLPYPGGPEIEKLARSMPKDWKDTINFPRPMLNQKNYNFSFSGLKTAVLYYIRDLQRDSKQRIHSNTANNFSKHSHQFVVSNREAADIAASFQRAAFDVLIKKTLRAANEFKAKSIFISGGVSANKTLAREFKKALRQLNVKGKKEKENKKSHSPFPILYVTKYPTDNGVMIASAAYINYLRKKKYPMKANGNLGI